MKASNIMKLLFQNDGVNAQGDVLLKIDSLV